MKIGVITDSIDDQSAGVGTYARGLAQALPATASGHEVTFVHRRPDEFYRGRSELVFPGWGSKLVRKQLLMSRALGDAGFDLVHETFHFPPFLAPARFVKVMTIHDMTPFVQPRRNMSLRNWLWHRLLLPPLARRADHILTDSEHSRRDIVKTIGLPPDRVSVAHLAADEQFRPRSLEEQERARSTYRLPERFLLFVGTIEPRKNLVRLVRAYERAAPALGDVGLVIAGSLGWRYGPILDAVRRSPAGSRICLPGPIAGEDLPAVYSAALAFVYPSLYEGFGLPPLEAMQCGCPVITSNVSSLPEVVGDAAITLDPLVEAGLAHSIERLAHDEALREELREKGVRRAQCFSWRQCAEATVAGYERAFAA